MKIAFASVYKALDIHSWSGTSFHMAKMLESMGHEVDYIDEIKPRETPFLKLKMRLLHNGARGVYMPSREPAVLRAIAKEIENRTEGKGYDLIFTPGQRILGQLETDIPTAFFGDATFSGLVDYYPDFSNLCRYTLENSIKMEKRALENASLAIFSSEWAANSALNTYDMDPNRVKVINFGSNFPHKPTDEDVQKFIGEKDDEVFEFLFMGVLWKRKGGDVALKVVEELHRRGRKVKLHLVGCQPPENIDIPDYVIPHGFLSKKKQEDLLTLQKLIEKVHFLLLPNTAECTAIVYNEVNSFGVPVLTTNTGGVPSVITPGENGYLFDIGDVIGYVNQIEEIMDSSGQYVNLAERTRKFYNENLTWEVSAAKMKEAFQIFG